MNTTTYHDTYRTPTQTPKEHTIALTVSDMKQRRKRYLETTPSPRAQTWHNSVCLYIDHADPTNPTTWNDFCCLEIVSVTVSLEFSSFSISFSRSSKDSSPACAHRRLTCMFAVQALHVTLIAGSSFWRVPATLVLLNDSYGASGQLKGQPCEQEREWNKHAVLGLGKMLLLSDSGVWYMKHTVHTGETWWLFGHSLAPWSRRGTRIGGDESNQPATGAFNTIGWLYTSTRDLPSRTSPSHLQSRSLGVSVQWPSTRPTVGFL